MRKVLLTYVLLILVALVAPVRAQVGSGWINGAANFPLPDFSSCDFAVPSTFSNVWYIDPVHGTTQTAGATGSITSPFNSLQAVFTTVTGYSQPLLATAPGGNGSSVIHPGDEILLNTGPPGTGAGQYGDISIPGPMSNSSYAVVAAAPGQSPVLNSINLAVGSGAVNHLAFENIAIQQSNAALTLLNVGNATNIVFSGVSISSASYATAATWTTQALWNANASGGGFRSVGNNCISFGASHIFNVSNAVALFSSQTDYEFNEVDHWLNDGTDFGFDNFQFRHNHYHDPINPGPTNPSCTPTPTCFTYTHLDMMQGYTVGLNHPVSRNVWLDSNLMVFQEDAALPFMTGNFFDGNGMLGNTDSQWVNLVITNNLVVSISSNGTNDYQNPIALFGGCNDCLISNNTVVGLTNGGISVDPKAVPPEIQNDSNVIVSHNLSNTLGATFAGLQAYDNVVFDGGGGLDVFYNGSGTGFVSAPGTYVGNNTIDSGGLSSELPSFNLSTLTYNFHLSPTAPAKSHGSFTILPRPLTDYYGHPTNSPIDSGAIAYP